MKTTWENARDGDTIGKEQAKQWHVIADPAWKGKHPLHDARFVATCDESKIEVTENDDGEKSWRFEDPADSIICTMPDSPKQKEHARLIAAAPDLLEACKGLLWAVEGTHIEKEGEYREQIEAAQTAIQKAGGAL